MVQKLSVVLLLRNAVRVLYSFFLFLILIWGEILVA